MIGIHEIPDWLDDALCRQVDPDLFHPQHGQNTAAAAKRICRSCPVQVECLQYALDRGERFGVWGGLSERERRTITRDRRQEAA